jgi:hypothetical protein
MKKLFYFLILLFLNSGVIAQINLATGTSGTITGFAQSFNETRGVDVYVLSPSDLQVQSMTLGGFYCGTGGIAYVGARIYNSSNGALLAGATDTVYNIFGGSVTVPVSFTLVSGSIYRVSFYCSGPNPPTNNSGIMFQPTSFPYVESSNLLQVIQAYSYPADTIPYSVNIFVPLITLNVSATGINEINLEDLISVTPNPANRDITLKFNNATNESCTLQLFNSQGRLMQAITGIRTGNVEIKRESLAKGLYFFQLKSEKKDIASGKIVLE